MLRLTFLGTGTSQGVPMIGCGCEVCRSDDRRDKRLRSSVMVEHFPDGATDGEPSTRVIIDAGPDFRYQMLRENVGRIDAILLTHEHKDHIAGIDDVRAFNYFQDSAIAVYAADRVAKVVRKDFDYAFAENKYPGAPDIDLRIIDPGKPFRIGAMEIFPVQGLHYRLPVLGFRVGGIVYLTDFNSISDAEVENIKGVDILVVNALRYEKHLSHFTVEEAIEVSRRVVAKETYLTHMSHQIGLHGRMEGTLPQGVHFAYDGLRLELE